MKKTLFVLMAFVLMLAVLFAVPEADAAEAVHPHSAEGHCVCGGAVAGHSCQTLTEWTGISGEVNFGTLDSGNYYLTGDVTAIAENEQFIGKLAVATTDANGKATSYSVEETRDLVICLNGYNITAKNDRTFKGVTIGSSLTITDCSYDATTGTWGGTVTGGSSNNGGIIYTYAKSTFNVYGGNFTGKEGVTNSNGGLIVIAQDRGDVASSTSVADQYSTFNLYNGYFYGGSAKNGGNMNFMHYVHVNIYGGIIEGGTATAGGGNIYSGKAVILNICGTEENPVVIRNGSAAVGGNVNLPHTAANLSKKVSVSNAVICGGTASDHSGNLRINSSLDMPGVTMYDCAPEVAAVWQGSTLLGQYTTLAEAAQAANGDSGKYVRMMADVVEESIITTDLYIDLAGYAVAGITCEGEIYGMDSATDDYTSDKAGSLTVAKAPQRHYKATAQQAGKVKRYLAVEENGTYSFHRFYMGVTAVVLSPDNDGMGYKASFAGSEVVKNQLKDFGMAVSLNELADTLDQNAYRFKSADKFVTGQVFEQKLIVSHILTEDTPDNHDLGLVPIYARSFIRLKDGTAILSNQYGSNLTETVEAVDDRWADYDWNQKLAVYSMLTRYPLSISGWGVQNAHHFENSFTWSRWTGTWEDGGHYYLTSDYTLTSTISVPAGKTLNICLNGHRFEGDVSRMFKVYGTLNIHDHRQDDGTYAGCVTSVYDTPVMAPVFYVYENGAMNLCGGNLTYSGTGVMTRGGVGMVGNNDKIGTVDAAYFNMYYGTISGGNVQAVLTSAGAVNGSKNGFGGNLDLVDKAVVNLYNGSITGGQATYVEASNTNGQGGNISVSSSDCVLNLHSVEITGGNSGVYLHSGTVNLYDDVKITGNQDYNLYVPSGKTVTANQLSGASVGVTTPGTDVFTTVTDNAYADCFTADAENVWVVNESGGLYIAHGHCVCGKSAEGVADHRCEGIIFKALSGTTNFGSLSAGHYYLTSDVTVTGTTNFNDKAVSICLNGYDITPGSNVASPFGRVRADAQLNICDCSGHQDESGSWSWDGTVHGGAGINGYGGVVGTQANSLVNIYGGNFVGTEGAVSGGVFNVCNDGFSAVTDLPEGADQYDDVFNTTFNMYNGYVKGGSVTTNGGAINCWHYVDVNIYGGTITGGTAGGHGGNITASSGTLTIKNAVISDGTAGTYAGNIYVASSSDAYLTGATVTGGTATDRGGNIYMASNSHVYMDDATVTGGTAKMGGGVFNYMATVHVDGNTVIDGNENYNLHQFLSKAVDVGTLDSSAKIGVYSEVKGLLLNTASYTARFYSEDSGYSLVPYSGNTLYLKTGTSLSYSSVSGFTAGYGEVDISPEENGVPLGGYGTSSTRLSTEVDANGRLYVMTTAVTDEKGNTILIVACDQIRFTSMVTNLLRQHMSAATGVPVENIYINCSHTHSVPDPATTDDISLRYRAHMYNGFVESAILAMKDRKAATMQTGSFEVGANGATQLNFVRHYQYTDADGVVHYFGDNFGTAVYDETTKHVSEADPTMFLVKFVRSGTDILLTNWRAHPHFTGGTAKTVVSSDYVGPFRDAAEAMLDDTEVVFLQGAAGNINEKSRTQLGDNHGLDYIGYGQELASQLKDNISCLKTVSTGLVQTKQTKFDAYVDHETDDLIEQAREVNNTYWDLDSTARKELLAKYGFSSVYHAGAIIARYNMEETENVEINVFSIGDQVGFYTVPGELWDSASVVIEESSPFPITMCVGYSLGDYKYFTYDSAWTYESYETANYRLTVPDTLLKMMDIWSAGLEELFENAQ